MHVLSTGLLVELDNDPFKVVESEVDVDGLLLEQSLYAGLLDTFRAGEIDEVDRGYSFDVAARLGGLDVDDEDAVGTGGLVVLGSLADDAVGVADEEVVEGVLLVLAVEALQVVELQLPVGALPRVDLGQVFQLLCHVF